MTIIPEAGHGRFTVFASRYAKLDSDVKTGGGSDDTAALQEILDMAPVFGGLHLILDGAARVTGLTVHANTTIECMGKQCGLFLSEGSNCALLHNARPSFKTISDENITLIGGTYNHNSPGQAHHIGRAPDPENGVFGEEKWTIAFEFYGVRNLTMRDVTIRNQRTFAMLIANWENVNMQDIAIDLPDNQYGQNQDGIHFWGPGRFLSMRNIRGGSGDDFIALAPDENDLVSSITDVHIDGVFLDDADQGIRMLSRGSGRLDRVYVRNVTGTYKSFGFFINAWFPGTGGSYGSISFENIDLRRTTHKYQFYNPFLFRFGGNMESIVLKNIRIQDYEPKRAAVEIGIPFHTDGGEDLSAVSHIRSITVDGIEVMNGGDHPGEQELIQVMCPVDVLTVDHARILNVGGTPGHLVRVSGQGDVDVLRIQDSMVKHLASAVEIESGRVGTLMISGLLTAGCGTVVSGQAPERVFSNGVYSVD